MRLVHVASQGGQGIDTWGAKEEHKVRGNAAKSGVMPHRQGWPEDTIRLHRTGADTYEQVWHSTRRSAQVLLLAKLAD